jgi:hypothetical protein
VEGLIYPDQARSRFRATILEKISKKSGQRFEQACRLLFHFRCAAGEMKGHHGQQRRLKLRRE